MSKDGLFPVIPNLVGINNSQLKFESSHEIEN